MCLMDFGFVRRQVLEFKSDLLLSSNRCPLTEIEMKSLWMTLVLYQTVTHFEIQM